MILKIKRMGFITVIALLLLPSLQGKDFAAYYDDSAYQTAANLLNQGLYLEALGIYQEIANFSDDQESKAKALLYMGNVYSLFLDRYTDALKQYAKIIQEYPQSLASQEAIFNSGMVLYESSEFKSAYDYFSLYIQKYPDGLQKQSAEIWADSAQNRMHEKQSKPPSPTLPVVSDSTIRVLIQDASEKATIRSENTIKVMDSFSGKGVVTVKKTNPFVTINNVEFNHAQCRIEAEGGIVILDGRQYRGAFHIIAGENGVQIINHLPLEQYLYGVIPREMSPIWPKSALMAQAVASRTYALYIKSKSKDKPFDVVAATASQVYGGFDAEVNTSNQAVDLTQSQVMTHDGKLIVAYFHSSSGGYTEDAQNVWGADLPYLKAAPDRYSEYYPNNAWEYRLGYRDLKDRLNQYGLNIGKIQKLMFLNKTRSGRMRSINILSDNGSHILQSNAFRIKMDPTKLKSTLMSIESDANTLLIRGKGYGHGVGMSQWGAKRMAEEGMDYRKILKHYYKDVDIVVLKNQ